MKKRFTEKRFKDGIAYVEACIWYTVKVSVKPAYAVNGEIDGFTVEHSDRFDRRSVNERYRERRIT